MEKYTIDTSGEDLFRVLEGTSRSQAAAMTLAPGRKTGGPDNRHEGSDQWLFVVSGSGEATVEGKRIPLAAGDLLLIAAGESHATSASDHEALVTVNIYAPPEY